MDLVTLKIVSQELPAGAQEHLSNVFNATGDYYKKKSGAAPSAEISCER